MLQRLRAPLIYCIASYAFWPPAFLILRMCSDFNLLSGQRPLVVAVVIAAPITTPLFLIATTWFPGEITRGGRLALWFAYGIPLAGAWIFSSFIPRPVRRATGLCPTCGCDIRATPDRCPECGADLRLYIPPSHS